MPEKNGMASLKVWGGKKSQHEILYPVKISF